MKTFYVTTPIYYSNGIPHIGHAYASFIADVLAKHRRNLGFEVKFSTGVDENSQKVVEKAAEAGMGIMEYCDSMAGKHQAIWDGLGITYTDFVRTTNYQHKTFVQGVLQKSFDNGDIYLGEYEGLYCVGCEAFKKASDLTEDGLCPDHKKKPDVIKEKNYFFRLSKYEAALKELFAGNPDFIVPRTRGNEVVSFIEEGLEDFSISREGSTFGIPLPFDNSHVTYVWYDALFNYVSACEGGDEKFWPADVHVVGKDIIRFHAIFWPAMLMSAGYALPKNILATGHFTIDGQKISKSLGNAIDPVEFCGQYPKELLLLYLLTSFPIGQDGDFSVEQAVNAFNAKLANNLGNLLNRFLVLSLKQGGKIDGLTDSEVEAKKTAFVETFQKAMEAYDLRAALESAFEFGDVLNKFVDTKKPWDKEATGVVDTLHTVGEGLRAMAICLMPFFPEKMSELLDRMGLASQRERLLAGKYSEVVAEKTAFSVAEKGEPLFLRIA